MIKDIVKKMDDSLAIALNEVQAKTREFKVGDKVIAYNFHGYGRELIFNVDTIKSITKTGIINLTTSTFRFKETRSLGDAWHPFYLIHHCNAFEDAYKAGTKLINADKVIKENLHLLPQEEIITLAENILFLKNKIGSEANGK